RPGLPYLDRGRTAARRERAGAHGLHSLPLELLEETEVQGEPSHGGFGDLTHSRHFCETFHKATAPPTPRQRALAAARRTPRAPPPRAVPPAGSPPARAPRPPAPAPSPSAPGA